MRSRMLAIAVAATSLVAACGSDDSDDSSDTEAPPASEVTAPTSQTEAPADTATGGSGDELLVGVATTDLGEVLVDRGGFVLYGFTPDEGGTPTCDDGCADAWPPVVVESAELPAGLDAAVFTVAERSDGSHQLVAGGWPLYRYAGDISPGDSIGQSSGGVWFIVAADGTLIGT